MDQLAQDIFGQVKIVAPITSYDLLLALASSTALTMAMAKLYAVTHGGYSYSKSFLQTIVLVGVTVALIMVIIGSDIARAFALVGAMSIVRFRTPLKDSRDLVFIFAAIAVGMACGVQFHIFAAIFTAFMFAIVMAFHYWRFGEIANNGYVVKLRIDGAVREKVGELLSELCQRFSVVSVSRTDSEADIEEVIYEVELKRGISYQGLVQRLNQSVSPQAINVLVGEGNVNV
jgi:Domain of unknown function (DUF4956)